MGVIKNTKVFICFQFLPFFATSLTLDVFECLEIRQNARVRDRGNFLVCAILNSGADLRAWVTATTVRIYTFCAFVLAGPR
jgi:hypothetical protein